MFQTNYKTNVLYNLFLRICHITQALTNLEYGQEKAFIQLIVRCIIQDSGCEFEFPRLAPILQQSEEKDERDFFHHVDRLIFQEPSNQWNLEQCEAKRLVKLRMSKKEFKQFENSSRINRFFMRTFNKPRSQNKK